MTCRKRTQRKWKMRLISSSISPKSRTFRRNDWFSPWWTYSTTTGEGKMVRLAKKLRYSVFLYSNWIYINKQSKRKINCLRLQRYLHCLIIFPQITTTVRSSTVPMVRLSQRRSLCFWMLTCPQTILSTSMTLWSKFQLFTFSDKN